MLRVAAALILALLCHLLLFLLPLPQRSIRPRPMGKKEIKIELQLQQSPDPVPVQAAVPLPKTTSATKKTAPNRLRRQTVKKRFRKIAPAPEIPQNPPKSLLPLTVTHPSPLNAHNPKPVYPPLARRRNWQGTVLLAVLVSPEGGCKSIRIHSSSGYTILDKSALLTVKSWRFRPGMKGDKAVEMEILVPIHFQLHDR